jgi:hypothetical protein
MQKEELDEIYQFLAGYWYDREEDDAAIVNEFVGEVDPQIAVKYVDLIERFMASSEPKQNKADFIRRAVWRWFPPEEVDAPIKWLEGILSLLKEAGIYSLEHEIL